MIVKKLFIDRRTIRCGAKANVNAMRRHHRARISTHKIHMFRGVRSGTGVEGYSEDISVSYYIMDIEFCDSMTPHVRLSSTRCTVSRMFVTGLRAFGYDLLYQMARNRPLEK